jgi:hypothetical protein
MSPSERILDLVEWKSVNPPADISDGLPYPTHEGKLWIGSDYLDCVVLNTGQRVITEESFLRFFGAEIGDTT